MAFGYEDDDRPTRGNRGSGTHHRRWQTTNEKDYLAYFNAAHIAPLKLHTASTVTVTTSWKTWMKMKRNWRWPVRLWLFFCRWWSFNHHYVDGNFRARQCRTDTSNAFSHSITFESQLRCVYDDSSGRRVAIEANEMWVWHDVPAISSSWQIVLMLLIV